MNFVSRFVLCFATATLLAGCSDSNTGGGTTSNAPFSGVPNQPPPLPDRAQPKLQTIKLYLGAQQIDAELALTFDQQRTGMMYRTNLTDKDAMIFVRPYPERAAFWMKNCPESLSAAYIDPNGTILQIVHLEKQDTNAVLSTSDNIKYVLEVKDGWFQRHDISTGTVIQTEFGTLKKTFTQNQ